MAARKRRIEDYETRFKQASSVLVSISEDNTTPRNIRRAAKEALNSLQVSGQSHAIRAAQVNGRELPSGGPNGYSVWDTRNGFRMIEADLTPGFAPGGRFVLMVEWE